jgi:hypothetical protein
MSVLVVVLGACEPTGLRTFSAPSAGPPILCAAARVLPFRLVIDPTKQNPVRDEWAASGSRFEILWPPGFQLVGSPGSALADPAGRVVGRSGDVIDDAGGSGGDPITICGLGDVVYPLGPSQQ